ncbi:uncharacterized protein LOC130744543 [Lotus japonicus]|uniref:uncharacterized protein LOC130744541 n=1 Tax=Lotus japonicus TaxID=34305 RepID=UPI00258B0AA0|nr:uncharacterized protein LOC130744541 [Lotus japonicus]XP_057452700.1 uncharacterized protein LOC130744543 [Lotus japonicus]
MKRRRRVPVEETPSVSQKKAKSTPATYTSRQVDMKSKGKHKVVESSDKKVKKTAEKKKKIPRVDLESESDIEADVQDILTSEKNKFLWKYVCKRRIAKERGIGIDVLECKEIVALIERAGLRKTVLDIGKCYGRLVKEFLVNLSDDVGIPGSAEFRKVYVCGRCVTFSPAVINQALGRSAVEFVKESCLWTLIGVVNWIPSHHTSTISAILAKLIYRIGTEIPFHFGSLVFAQTLKHAETCDVKLPISFPSLLTAIILKQHPDILRMDDVAVSKGASIPLDHRLFLDPHVLDIDMPSRKTSIPVLVSASETVGQSASSML